MSVSSEGRPMTPAEFKRLRFIDPAGFGRRGELYAMLREAGDYGITTREFGQLGYGTYEVGIHCESLRLDGHAISRANEYVVAHATYTDRWVLTHDAWADQPVRAPAGAAGPEEDDVGAPPSGVSEEAPREGEASPDDA